MAHLTSDESARLAALKANAVRTPADDAEMKTLEDKKVA